MRNLLINHFSISLSAIISIAMGCGVMPAGQASTRTFTVSGLTTLPVAMAYTDKPDVAAQVRGISTSKDGAQAFVSRLVMQTVSWNFHIWILSSLLPFLRKRGS
ncbi:hypothetical protein KIN20_009963 [Parelaphostrongylus tenuis]|uniref:Uncharacterized protein n=1 Tax=Parelaphostrongylus tenuis TaxID=148309 RepID=A0AAD5MYE9_PARTN|nr:hypothetical protein KIN20_009963 [Parelaphostrongylus tenuis]